MNRELYRELAGERPTASALGGMFLALVEPHAGFERQYNRWYEDDHFYPAALAGPWIFAGRRWVATRELQAARLPGPTSVEAPFSAGVFLATYFITAGHLEDAREWQWTLVAETLTAEGRLNSHRDPIYAGYHDFRDGVVMDPAPMSHQAGLDHPYGLFVLELVDAVNAATRDQLIEWLRDELAPQTADRGQVIILTPSALDDSTRERGVPEPSSVRVCLAWLLPSWSAQDWDARFGDHESEIRESGLGTLVLAAPFLPLVPGTDHHIDEI